MLEGWGCINVLNGRLWCRCHSHNTKIQYDNDTKKMEWCVNLRSSHKCQIVRSIYPFPEYRAWDQRFGTVALCWANTCNARTVHIMWQVVINFNFICCQLDFSYSPICFVRRQKCSRNRRWNWFGVCSHLNVGRKGNNCHWRGRVVASAPQEKH